MVNAALATFGFLGAGHPVDARPTAGGWRNSRLLLSSKRLLFSLVASELAGHLGLNTANRHYAGAGKGWRDRPAIARPGTPPADTIMLTEPPKDVLARQQAPATQGLQLRRCPTRRLQRYAQAKAGRCSGNGSTGKRQNWTGSSHNETPTRPARRIRPETPGRWAMIPRRWERLDPFVHFGSETLQLSDQEHA